MSVTYLITGTVKPEQRERFLVMLNELLDAMRHEENFVNATLHCDPDDPCRFLLHETWVDHQDVLDVQLHRPYRQAWHEALPELLAKPREVSIWQPLRVDRKD
ncbi:antibiotic biosynthesis monooxygenase [Labrys sp. WJW]|uniref:putative quinol monooxygenase n=1 Tax=Labrys sp. WJW TaxID=1737983 RepID=UPI000832DF56|nr:putative quinol monooxygenase [Labrys sp. WJW]OCC06473.1 antibiotic biosynthesis monooxygenase [Labrys sp. WJW]